MAEAAPFITALSAFVLGAAALWRGLRTDRDNREAARKLETESQRVAAQQASIDLFDAVNRERKDMMQQMVADISSLRQEVAACEADKRQMRESFDADTREMRAEIRRLRQEIQELRTA